MKSRAIPLGAFELLEPLGTGGVAEVWTGIHTKQQLPVAVKIMMGQKTLLSGVREALRNEVRASASLDHLNIIRVLSYGEINAETQSACGGRFREGSPYIIMELAAGGTLRSIPKGLEWPQLRHIFRSILAALAHAHARRVIHLDVKPANVLLVPDARGAAVYKLADFGIAHITGTTPWQESDGDKVSSKPKMVQGTPPYMAPEQFSYAYHDFGPWTDLYALGCLAFALTTGSPPFMDTQIQKLAEAHFYRPPPPLKARMALPEGFEQWVGCLLEKRPSKRFQRCADAAWALEQLGEPPEELELDPSDLEEEEGGEEEVTAPTATSIEVEVESLMHPTPKKKRRISVELTDPKEGEALSSTLRQPQIMQSGPRPIPSEASLDAVLAGEVPALDGAPDGARSREGQSQSTPNERGSRKLLLGCGVVAPIPPKWHLDRPYQRPLTVLGAGLSLYGLRVVPMAGRLRERDVLWNALLESVHQQQARAVVLRGPSGTGKSRLAEWCVERAHEIASAEVLRAAHNPGKEPFHATSRMVARLFRCVGLEPASVQRRVQERLEEEGVNDEYEWTALAALIEPGNVASEGKDSSVRDTRPVHRSLFERPGERYALLTRLLRRLARRRPVVIWMDDVQWGSDALSLSDFILKAEPPCPVLLLLTVQEESLAENSLESGQVEELLQQPGARSLNVGPLSKAEHSTLVRDLMGLEGALAKRVVDRTGGNPLFAVQLVRDWVHRDLLETGKSGFRLKANAKVSLPEDMRQVWAERIEKLLGGQPSDARVALELAAALGIEVDNGEWQAVCELAGIRLPPGLLDALLASRLAQATAMSPDGLDVIAWTFLHGMLRESIEQASREAGRFNELKWMCGSMLIHRYGTKKPGIYERLGRYALEAGELEAALLPLLKAAESHRRTGDIRLAQRLLADREAALAHLKLPETDRRHAEGWMARASLFYFQGKVAESMALVARVEAKARASSWLDLHAECLRLRSKSCLERGEPVRAIRLQRQALKMFEQIGDRARVSNCFIQLANSEHDRGNMAAASKYGHKALSLSEQLGDVRGQADACLILGHISLMLRKDRKATAFFQRAVTLYAQIHYQPGVAQAIRCLGAGAATTHPDRAAEYYRKALGIFSKLGYPSGEAKCRNDLAELARARGDLEGAEEGYRKALALAAALNSGDVVVVKINLALVLLSRGNYAEAREMLEGCRQRVEAVERHLLLGAIHTMLLACAAAASDWKAWDEHFNRTVVHLRETGVVEPDDAEALQLAGNLARKAGEIRRARAAFALAQKLWRAVNRVEDSRKLSPLIQELGAELDETEGKGRESQR